MTNIFKGLGVALVTPFGSDGRIDFPSLCRIVDTMLLGDVDFLCLLGSTAETACLDDEEQQEVKQRVCQQVAGRLPILLGFGSNSTQALLARLEHFDLTGVDGLLSVSPFYNKPSQEGIYRHFRALASATELPVVVYNVPGRTASNMAAETTLRLAADCPNIVAVKEASGNIEQIQTILRQKPSGFDVLSGDDGLTCRLCSGGAAGVISVVANALPNEFGRLVHAALEGDLIEVETIDSRFKELYRLLSVDGNPAGIKALLNAQGKCQNVLRLPLTPASPATCQALQAFVR